METFQTHHATTAAYNAMPGPMTMAYSLLLAGSVTGLAYMAGDAFGGKGMWWMYGSMAVMTIIGLVLMLFRVRKAKKLAANREGFEDAVKGSAGGWDTPGAGNDPAEIARLDNLRKQFQKGIDTFREYGKDFYSLPWYVMVGEPGSGKTEAIRHSDLRFPETLQDMLQGTGGTYSMDWWFTNQAVLLDTAGAMLMNPEATKRFEEFLKLLRSFRPDCPVNGLILAIPVDSLLADTPAVLEEKAKRIAQQFSIIQKALDVRFPIYLMVTKSDRLPGFREFTDAPGQQTFDREMLGWSNPAGLDDPFDPGYIAGALDTIATRLEGRRLALLADPIARQPGNRRVDEVDSIFTFPETIRSLQPRLQRYMEILFQTGVWSNLPPFFRGVYFTSAMNEGAALDEQLASALGMSIETLPGGGIFNRDKSVYLRDVFTEKVFKERGLVTRLKDIGKALRRKLVWFYATTALLLLLLLGFAWLVKRGVESQLRIEQENWRVANNTWGNGGFLPIVSRSEGADAPDGTRTPPRWTAAWSADGAQVFKSTSLTRIEFLDDLERRTARGLPGAGMFRILGSIRDFERRRRVACLAIYEGSVFKPLLEGVREKIAWDAMPNAVRDAAADKRLANAYAALIRMEALVLGKSGRPDAEGIANILTPLMVYLCPPDGKDVNLSEANTSSAASQLAGIGERLYKGKVFGEEGTESLDTRRWLGTPPDASPESANLQAIIKGIETILGGVAESAGTSEDSKKQYKEAKELAVKNFQTTEDELSGLNPATASRARVEELLNVLKTQLDDVQNMKSKLGEATRLAGMGRGDLAAFCTSLKESLEPLTAGDMPAHLKPVHEKAMAFLKTYTPEKITDSSAGPDKPDAAPQLSPEDGAQVRYEFYRRRLSQAEKIPMPALTLDLVGSLESQVKGIRERADAAAKAATVDYNGMAGDPRKDKAAAAAAAIDLCMGEIATGKLMGVYIQKLRDFLDPRLKFPLVQSARHIFSAAEFKPAVDQLQKVVKDKTWFDGADATVRAAAGADVLARMFEALNDVITISRVLNPDNSAQPGGDGLYIQRGFVKAAEKKPDPNAPVQPTVQIDPITGQPRIIPAPPAPEVEVGVLTAEVSQGGVPLIGGTGQATKVKIKPNQPLQFLVEVRRPGDAQSKTFRASLPTAEFTGVWGLVSWLIKNPGRNFGVGGVGFGVDSSPALPGVWPVRRSFGLND
jgi:hypothetical protein